MKKYVFSLLLSGLMASVTFGQAKVATAGTKAKTKTTAVTKTPASPAAEAKASFFKWSESAHNFGAIPQGKPVTTTFNFTNTGKEPVMIYHVQGSCGCTATDYSKEPVAPGKTGYVKATYNAASPGHFNKTVTVKAVKIPAIAAADSTETILVINGDVKTANTPAEKSK